MTPQLSRKAQKLNWHMKQTDAGQVIAYGHPDTDIKGLSVDWDKYYIELQVGNKTIQQVFSSARALHEYMNKKLAFYQAQQEIQE